MMPSWEWLLASAVTGVGGAALIHGIANRQRRPDPSTAYKIVADPAEPAPDPVPPAFIPQRCLRCPGTLFARLPDLIEWDNNHAAGGEVRVQVRGTLFGCRKCGAVMEVDRDGPREAAPLAAPRPAGEEPKPSPPRPQAPIPLKRPAV
jgi:hypothetical protein